MKCSVIPIQCSEDQLGLIRDGMGFRLEAFPIKYLGLPLTIRKPSVAQFQDLVDGIASKLPTWHAATLDKGGRLNMLQSALCAMPVHAMLALDDPPKLLSKIIRIYHGLLWVGAVDARGGQCAVARDIICQPKLVGGLGLSDLRWLNHAMRVCWLWLKRRDSSRPWAEFAITVSTESHQIYQATIFMEIGDSSGSFFWEDSWLHGWRI